MPTLVTHQSPVVYVDLLHAGVPDMHISRVQVAHIIEQSRDKHTI